MVSVIEEDGVSQILLPEDLVERILSYLPMDSLSRFRTVSTQWNSLIFSTPFLKLWTACTEAHKNTPWTLI
ncbi:hypothetical protein KI387_024597, partial [Taxus chinensis]